VECAGGGFDGEASFGAGCWLGVAGCLLKAGDFCAEECADFGLGALVLEHGEDVLCGAVAEELAEGFLVVGDVVLFYEGDDVGGGVAA
jgi:hypothetical protein